MLDNEIAFPFVLMIVYFFPPTFEIQKNDIFQFLTEVFRELKRYGRRKTDIYGIGFFWIQQLLPKRIIKFVDGKQQVRIFKKLHVFLYCYGIGKS